MNNRATILVVDDEMGLRDSLRMILSPYYNVYTAERGEESLELLRQVPIDLVTVELKMPGLSGIAVLEKIKQHNGISRSSFSLVTVQWKRRSRG